MCCFLARQRSLGVRVGGLSGPAMGRLEEWLSPVPCVQEQNPAYRRAFHLFPPPIFQAAPIEINFLRVHFQLLV